MQYSILHLCVLSKLADYSEGVRKFGLVWQLWLLRLQDTQIITFSRIRGTIGFFLFAEAWLPMSNFLAYILYLLSVEGRPPVSALLLL